MSDKPEQLAKLIEKGRPIVAGESIHFIWLKNDKYYTCPIGMALVGYCGSAKEAFIKYLGMKWDRMFKDLADALRMPEELILKVSSMQVSGVSTQKIIQALRNGELDQYVTEV